MRAFLIISISFFSFNILNAQILNSGFENWTNMGSYEVPDQWGTMNNATSHLNVFTVTKWYPGSPGAYFMKITSKMYGSNVMNGIAVYGKLDSTTMQPISGYPYSLRPAAFTGQWQHMIWGNSQGSVCATLTKWNISQNKRDTIAIAYEELFDMAMQWEAFSVNFNYLSNEIPDSCMIVLKSSGDAPTLNDYLWVDDLAFSGLTNINTDFFTNSFEVYPIPCSDNLNIHFNSKISGNIKFELIDITGRVILLKEEKLNEYECTINISQLAKGTYFLRSDFSDKNYCRKIIVN
jgi:hypothetical protein